MDANENHGLKQLRAEATAYGEIAEVTPDSITITGNFSPGLGTYELRPGARVVILNDDDAMSVCVDQESLL